MPGQFLKIETDKEYEFQPLSLEFREKFALWDSKMRKFLRDGEGIKTEKGYEKISKFIKLSENDKKRYGRSLKYEFDALVNGEQKIVQLPKGAKDNLEKEYQTASALGQKPTDLTFSMKRVMGSNNILTYEIRLSPVKKQPSVNISLKKNEGTPLTLTAIESKVLEALKNSEEAKGFSYEDKIDVFVDNYNVEPERAKKIVDSFLMDKKE